MKSFLTVIFTILFLSNIVYSDENICTNDFIEKIKHDLDRSKQLYKLYGVADNSKKQDIMNSYITLYSLIYTYCIQYNKMEYNSKKTIKIINDNRNTNG